MEETKNQAVNSALPADVAAGSTGAPIKETKVKKSWKKRLLKIFAILVVLGVVAMVAVYIWLGNIIAYGINTAGPLVLGVKDVHVESVAANPLAGKFRIEKLFVGNPDGFDSEYLFRVNEVRIDVNLFSWFGEKFIINEIYIDAPEMLYHTNLTNSNVNQVLKNLESLSGGGTMPSKPKTEEQKKSGGVMYKKVVAHSIVIKNIKARASLLGAPAVGISPRDIQMNEIGTDSEVTVVGLVYRMIGQSMNALAAAVDGIKNLGSGTVDAAGNVIKGTGDVLKGTGDVLIKSSGGAIKGLFGGKKDEPVAPKTLEVPKK